MSVDLGAGSDKLTLGAFANTGTVTNVETVAGGSGADTITLASGGFRRFGRPRARARIP